MFFGNAHTYFSQKNQRFCLLLFQFFQRFLNIQNFLNLQRILHPHNTTGFFLHQFHNIKYRLLCICNLAQTIINFLLNTFQSFLFFYDCLLLQQQFFFHTFHIPIFHKIRDFLQRHIQSPQITNGIEHFELSGAVIAIPTFRVNIFRRQKSNGFVVAQTADAEMKHLPYGSNGKQPCPIHNATLLLI